MGECHHYLTNNTLVWPNTEQIIKTEFLEIPRSICKSLVCEGCRHLPAPSLHFWVLESYSTLTQTEAGGPWVTRQSTKLYASLVMANQISPECYQAGGERRGYKYQRIPNTWLGANARAPQSPSLGEGDRARVCCYSGGMLLALNSIYNETHSTDRPLWRQLQSHEDPRPQVQTNRPPKSK